MGVVFGLSQLMNMDLSRSMHYVSCIVLDYLVETLSHANMA
jgi:hypothetical protein